MDLMRIFLSRFAALFSCRNLDGDLDEELRTHIDLAVEEHLKRGMSEQVARATAQREFGSVVQTKERYRVQRGLPVLELIRSLRTRPASDLCQALPLSRWRA